MDIEEYIKTKWNEERLNEYSLFSGWHETLVKIIREVWGDAQANQSLNSCGAIMNIPHKHTPDNMYVENMKHISD